MSNMATITPRIVWDTLSLKQEFIKSDANKKKAGARQESNNLL